MIMSEALRVVSAYGALVEADSFIEAVDAMEVAYKMGTLTDREATAFQTVLGELESVV
jgi:hypothetical protein